ncbi:MAG: adenylate/guanylate cyclase domain-containing protein [Deltaproteobacteria bacterium]|nr:adenylate/guanylate cyclase domain-containing protein [Deltaproteobacteria bacterium]
MSILKKIFAFTPWKISLLIVLFFCSLSAVYDIAPEKFPLIQGLADKSIDYKFKVRGPTSAKSKIVIVGADDKAFTTYGQWPFDRASVLAPLIENLCKYNPKAVGFDIVWSEREKLIASGVKDALGASFAGRQGELDDILKNNSGDFAMRRAIDSCGSKIVLGYALQRDGKPDADFEQRAKLLTGAGNNTVGGVTGPKIKYGAHHLDPDANVPFYNIGRQGLLNIPEITPAGVAQGFFNNDEDSDGNYRRAFFLFRANESFVPSLALRMAQKFMNPKDTGTRMEIRAEGANGEAPVLKLEMDTPNGPRKLPIDLEGKAIVNYRGPNHSFPNISMADVLSPSDTLEYEQVIDGVPVKKKVHKSEFFKDALVIVGVTAHVIYDIRPRPFDAQAAGVENHASILDNIINDDFLTRPTSEMVFALVAALFFGGLAFGWIIARLDARFGAGVAALSIGGLLWFDQVYMFNNQRIVILGYLHAFQLLFQYLSITVMKYMAEENEKKFIRSAFDKYVSPDVINQMLNDPTKLKIGGDKKELTVLFSDIRGFTTLSERLDVKALATFLNEYLGRMTDILQANGGTLDKYIGDAVMGFWGAPLDSAEHAKLATKTALEMVLALEELNKEFEKKYGLTIDIGIGINTGPVTVGNFGSSRVFSYTVIGDNVNLASRLEGVNKEYGTKIIVSETTYAQLPQGAFLTREVDTVKVKGKHKPVKIYEVFPDNTANQPLKQSLKTFNEGLMHYYARQWEQALALFNRVLQARNEDKPSLELIERCKYYMGHPPAADWDGSWEMHTK